MRPQAGKPPAIVCGEWARPVVIRGGGDRRKASFENRRKQDVRQGSVQRCGHVAPALLLC